VLCQYHMTVVRQLSWQSILLICILLFSAITRFARLSVPPDYYFDEVYHVVTAKLMAHNDPSAYEWWHPAPEPNTAIDWLHPPLAKLTQAASMIMLGENSFGWRFSSAAFGIGVIALTYALSRKLRFSESISLLAAGLASLDGLLLTMSRIAMNDIHVTFFILLTLWMYLHWKVKPNRNRALLVGILAGAASASKWSGIFVILPIALDQAWSLLHIHMQGKKLKLDQSILLGLSLTVMVPLVYLASYGQMFLQGHDWQHFRDLHQQIWWYQTNLDATHPYQSTPLQWIFNIRPVYTYTHAAGFNLMQNMYIQGNAWLLWSGLATVIWTLSSLVLLGLRWAQILSNTLQASNKKLLSQEKQKLLAVKEAIQPYQRLVFVLLAYVSTWILWISSPRIMFFYHYTPAIPLLMIVLAYWLVRLAQQGRWGQILTGVTIALAIINFAVFYPNWTGIVVPESLSEIYFAFSSWR
jgi:dolichyl-phosphate-mannose-protein mannosyltransferase